MFYFIMFSDEPIDIKAVMAKVKKVQVSCSFKVTFCYFFGVSVKYKLIVPIISDKKCIMRNR